MQIAIPRALMHSYYYPLWSAYLQELGADVVVSPATNKELVDRGVKLAAPELCVPIKIYLGHFHWLLEQPVDYIFAPRFVSVQKGQFFCPKFMGLPDMLRFSLPGSEERMLSPLFTSRDDSLDNEKCLRTVASRLGVGYLKHRRAHRNAVAAWREFRALSLQGADLNQALAGKGGAEVAATADTPLTVGVAGYVYNLYDPYVSMDILAKLRQMGVRVITFEMLPDDVLQSALARVPKKLFWTFSDKLLALGLWCLDNPEVDALVHVTAFGCGPDSMLGKIFEVDYGKVDKPFMTVRIDEHSGENHLLTRVEAFVDMLSRKKRRGERA